MKNILLSVFIICLSLNLSAQNKNLKAYFSYGTFAVPGNDAYIETYLAIESNSVVFIEKEAGSFQASIEISMVFMQNDTVKNFAKYELKSPVITDLETASFGIIDQQRFSLPNGIYNLEIQILDLNNLESTVFKTIETIQLDYSSKILQLSAIQLIERFEKTDTENVLTKNGYDLFPMVYAFYPASSTNLNFYTEIYNTATLFGDEGKFLVNYYIESFEGGNQMKNFFFRKRMDVKPVNILLNAVEISQLPSGNYYLVVEVRDQSNEIVVENKVFFQRSNPNIQINLTDIASVNTSNTFAEFLPKSDTLREFLLCLAPISSESERDYAFALVETDDYKTMQQFLYNFWQSRNNIEPEQAWLKYYEEVKKVNAAYKTPTKKGYATDRGRVYLKYGPPNQMVESYSEPSAYPYEIWHYYTIERQRNKRFVFSTRDMVTNDFILIHSDAVGELSNYRWQLDIYRRSWDPTNIDATGPDDIYGNKAYDYYKNPR